MVYTKRRKLCWDCGGEVPEEVATCPFCGGSFEGTDRSQNEKLFDGIYDFTNVPQSPIKPSFEFSDESTSLPKQELDREINDHEQSRHQIMSLLFLLPGMTLFILSCGIFLFSQEGYLTLRYNATYTLFIFLLSTISIYFGIRSYKKLKAKN